MSLAQIIQDLQHWPEIADRCVLAYHRCMAAQGGKIRR